MGNRTGNSLFLNLEDDRLGTPDLDMLDRAVEIFFRRAPEARSSGAWLFLDEIQLIPGWERFTRRILDTEQARLFIAGSSARLLSTEVATAFRGRSIVAEVLPFSVREAARTDGEAALMGEAQPGAIRRSNMDAYIETYLRVGGFPAVRTLNPYDRLQALQEYVELVVLRDVSERHGATNLSVLRELVLALFASNTNGFSVSRLHGALVSQGWKVGKSTLLTYLGHLADGFLVFLLPLRTRSARKRAVNPRKVYSVDPGLAMAMYQGGAENRGAQLENAVYLDLRRRFGRLSETVLSWYKTASGKEVDFVVDDPVQGGAPLLIQVSEHLDVPSTRQREVAALMEAMTETRATKGTIVTRSTEDTMVTDAGVIRVVPARQWFFRPEAFSADAGQSG